ncbi:MAG: hypothetical protein ACOVO2_02920 [Emticicia sp.]|uniref:hypothetical protein n=1 Tax=Emticicia sp. TaxID=1930953 RepID=UPI003BA4083E
MLLTLETKEKLLTNVESRLNELANEVDNLGKLFTELEAYKTFFEGRNLLNPFENLKDILNFRLIVGIINLDLCAATLTYLRGKFQYETISASRQIIVIISEGYKKIYNFIAINEKGDKVLKHRNNSFWIKEIGQIINSELPELRQEYEDLTKKLDNYLVINFDVLKTQRDLSVHYDKEPMKVYNMIIKLDIEESFKKLILFLDILNNLFAFTQLLVNSFQKKIEQANLEQDKRIDTIADLLDKHMVPNNEKISTDFKEQILSLKKLYR